MAYKIPLFGEKPKNEEMKKVMENIANAEGEIQQRIYQLGQMYYDKYKDDMGVDQNFYNIIDLITKLDKNRRSFYKNKLKLEGQMMCEGCGSIIPYGSVFCNICGNKADEKQEGSIQQKSGDGVEICNCNNCGAVLLPNSLFCTECGQKIELKNDSL